MAHRDACLSDAPSKPLAAPEPTSALDRRTMLKGLAIAGAAVPVLAACGSSSDSSSDPPKTRTSSTPPTSGGDATSPPPAGSGDVLAKASAVPVGGGVILPDKTQVITQPKAGTFEGFSSTCTHMGCTVATISNGTINCPCHGSMYSITDGSVQGGPAPAPLPKKPVKKEGANIVPA
jgi:Rieske Fe-S protein